MNDQNPSPPATGALKTAEPFIVFELANTSYALPSRDVVQIDMIEHITPVPNAAPCVEGVVFSRNQVIPAINLRVRFGFDRTDHNLQTRLVVVQVEGRQVGMIVDSAREFIRIQQNSIQPPPETITGLSGKYLEGIATISGQRLILILSLAETLNLTDLKLEADIQR